MPVCPCSRGRQALLDLMFGKDKSVVGTALVKLLVSMGKVSESESWLIGKWGCERLSDLSGGLGSASES